MPLSRGYSPKSLNPTTAPFAAARVDTGVVNLVKIEGLVWGAPLAAARVARTGDGQTVVLFNSHPPRVQMRSL